MSNPLISVIVPVYKVEPYLERCVNSIRNQTYTNLEIILVDDGSPDRCGEMCDALAKEDSRVRVFHKENGGQSSARNLGLDNMTGEYVGFVDSDDWIEPDMYQHLYDLLVEYRAQVSCCGTQKDFPNGQKSYFNPYYPKETGIRAYNRKEALCEMLQNVRITYSPCDKLYHKDVFVGLRMTEGQIYEDMEILPKWVERANTVVYDPVPKYHYIMTETSTIRGIYNLRRMRESDIALAKAEDYKIRYPELYDEAMARYIAICLSVIHLSRGIDECAQRRSELIKQIRGDIPRSVRTAMRKPEKLKLAVFRFSPFLYDGLISLYEKLTNRK